MHLTLQATIGVVVPRYALLYMVAFTALHAVDDFEDLSPSILQVRLGVGTATAFDRVEGTAEYNGEAIPGPQQHYSDGIPFDIANHQSITLTFITPQDRRRDDLQLGIVLNWDNRVNSYDLDPGRTPDLAVSSYGISLLAMRSMPLARSLMLEWGARIGGGVLRSEQYVVSPVSGQWQVTGNGVGVYGEIAIRTALIHHFATWSVGVQAEYSLGAGSTTWDDSGYFGETSIDTQYRWYGLGTSLFIGHEF